MQTLQISILIDSRICAYLFGPIISQLTSRGVRVLIYTPSQIRRHVQEDIGSGPLLEYCDLDPICQANRWRWYLHRTAKDLFTRSDFSYQFYKRREQISRKLSFGRRILTGLSNLTPKVPNSSINRFLGLLAGLGHTNPFRTSAVMVGSLPSCPELLSSRNQTIITVMESWDHAVKEPNGYESDVVFVWNNSLGEDWRRVHGDQNVHVFYPLKLRYAQSISKSRKKTPNTAIRPFCVYAVAGTSRFSIPILIDIEKRLILDLARATSSAGWDLFIKPRPNGAADEFVEFQRSFSNVRIGSILEQDVQAPANYFLTEAYNHRRFAELEGCKFVINAFTTFGLDAAVAGIPVLQIDLREAHGYKDTQYIYNNYHIQTYLLPRDYVLRVKGNFVEEFSNFLSMPNNYPERYSAELTNWLFSNQSQEEALASMTERVIQTLMKCNSEHSTIG